MGQNVEKCVKSCCNCSKNINEHIVREKNLYFCSIKCYRKYKKLIL